MKPCLDPTSLFLLVKQGHVPLHPHQLPFQSRESIVGCVGTQRGSYLQLVCALVQRSPPHCKELWRRGRRHTMHEQPCVDKVYTLHMDSLNQQSTVTLAWNDRLYHYIVLTYSYTSTLNFNPSLASQHIMHIAGEVAHFWSHLQM